MKDKSFILRSSRITSKTFSTITPTFVQALSHKSSPNEFYSSIGSGHNTISHQQLKSQLSQKDQELKQRLVGLTSNLKNIEKQYKDNLKDGFQNKIKSYRLQAVVQRKMLKQTIQETIRLNEMQDIKEKYQMALKRKQFAQYKAFKQQQMRLKNIQQLKNKSLQEKKNLNHQISVRAKEIQSKNKSLHDRIISEQKYKDRKKNYLEYWKQEKLKKDQFEQKKQFLQKIITNTRKIKGLKEELQNVQKRCEILLEDNEIFSKEKSTLFVTI